MKQLSLLTILFCLLTTLANAATVSGTVTNASTSNPVSGQKIYVFDSLGKWVDSTLTNTSGVYSFTVPLAVPNGDLIMVTTTACGAGNMNSFFFAGSSVTSNFSICGGTFLLHGSINVGGLANSGPAMVYLIRQYFDPTTMSTMLSLVDSALTSGASYSMSFSSIPYGVLLLKVALRPGHTSYASYLPTYYTSSLMWSGATALSSSNFNSSNVTNLTLISGTNLGGPGFIGGSVLLGANKNTGVGDPLNGRILIITNASGQPVGYTYSNASGQFSFSNLAYGTYTIFGDAWGKTNPPLTVTISASQASISNVVFEENNSTFKGHIGNLAVNGGTALQSVSIYPNPASNYISLGGLAGISGGKTVVLRDVRGAIISSTEIKAGTNANIATGTLPAGMYMLNLQTAEGSASYKFIKE